MDSQDYLDQISKSVRPVKPPRKGLMGILTSKYFMWGGIAVGLLIVIMIFGSMLGSKEPLSDKVINLKLHMDGTNEVVSQYQPIVKSSQLRSLSASLRGILANTSSQLNTFIIQTYGDKAVKETMVEAAALTRDGLMNELFESKINGYLDRMYAHKITLEVYSFMSEEAGIINATSDEALKSLLTSSQNSLNNLYTQFNGFSETTNQ